MLLDPRYRIATETPMFRSCRANRPDAADSNTTCVRQRTGDLALSKVAKNTPAKRKPLILKNPKNAAPVAPGDFVLDHALKRAGKRTAPWEQS